MPPNPAVPFRLEPSEARKLTRRVSRLNAWAEESRQPFRYRICQTYRHVFIQAFVPEREAPAK